MLVLRVVVVDSVDMAMLKATAECVASMAGISTSAPPTMVSWASVWNTFAGFNGKFGVGWATRDVEGKWRPSQLLHHSADNIVVVGAEGDQFRCGILAGASVSVFPPSSTDLQLWVDVPADVMVTPGFLLAKKAKLWPLINECSQAVKPFLQLAALMARCLVAVSIGSRSPPFAGGKGFSALMRKLCGKRNVARRPPASKAPRLPEWPPLRPASAALDLAIQLLTDLGNARQTLAPPDLRHQWLEGTHEFIVLTPKGVEAEGSFPTARYAISRHATRASIEDRVSPFHDGTSFRI